MLQWPRVLENLITCKCGVGCTVGMQVIVQNCQAKDSLESFLSQWQQKIISPAFYNAMSQCKCLLLTTAYQRQPIATSIKAHLRRLLAHSAANWQKDKKRQCHQAKIQTN